MSKTVRISAALLILLSAFGASACEPKWNRGAAVRKTLDAQVRGTVPPPEVREHAAKAHAALATWQSDLALRLDVAVDESEDELSRAFAVAGRDDLHSNQSLQLFSSATEMISRATSPLDRDGVEAVAQLLEKSRELARGARKRTPTAASPQNSLKTLRKHQSDPSQYLYNDEK